MDIRLNVAEGSGVAVVPFCTPRWARCTGVADFK